VGARTWEVDATTVLDKRERYIYVYWIHTCVESCLQVLLTNMAIVRNFKTTYGTTYLAQDEGVITQHSKGEERVKGFCPKTWWWCETFKVLCKICNVDRKCTYVTVQKDRRFCHCCSQLLVPVWDHNTDTSLVYRTPEWLSDFWHVITGKIIAAECNKILCKRHTVYL